MGLDQDGLVGSEAGEQLVLARPPFDAVVAGQSRSVLSQLLDAEQLRVQYSGDRLPALRMRYCLARSPWEGYGSPSLEL